MAQQPSLQIISFDCYGTLIDWETGILRVVSPILRKHGVKLSENQILEFYASAESAAESQAYRPYPEILREVMFVFAERFSLTFSEDELTALVATLPEWRPFSDTVKSLRRLQERYQLAIISNISRDLFQHTQRSLQVDFDWVITAEDVRAYKPSLEVFSYAQRQFGVEQNQHLHVAQSLYHDIAPAKYLHIPCAWINRHGSKPGSGATPFAQIQPDLEAPDLPSFCDLILRA